MQINLEQTRYKTTKNIMEYFNQPDFPNMVAFLKNEYKTNLKEEVSQVLNRIHTRLSVKHAHHCVLPETLQFTMTTCQLMNKHNDLIELNSLRNDVLEKVLSIFRDAGWTIKRNFQIHHYNRNVDKHKYTFTLKMK